MTDEPDDLLEFLKRDGAIEILATIHPDGTRFGELEEKIGASTDSLWRRLEEGLELDIVEPRGITGERGASHAWALTAKGARLRYKLRKMGMVEDLDLYRMYRERMELYEEEFREWVDEIEEGGSLDDVQENQDALAFWREAVERDEELDADDA